MKSKVVSPTALSTVPYRRRAVDCRYGLCQAGARESFRSGYGRLQSAFEEQERGQNRRASAGYHHGNPTCMWYRCDSLPSPDPGGTLAIDLKDDDDFSCCCYGEQICRLGGSRPCVFATVGVRHRRQVGQVQGSSSRTHSNKRMPTMLEGMVVFVAVEAKPWFSRRTSARGERRSRQRGGSSVLNEALTAKPSS